MTEITTRRTAGHAPGRLAARIARLRRQLSDRVHVGGDVFAREHGWTITTTTGRLGFSTRSYRDPRFDQRRAAARSVEPLAGQGPGRPR